MDNKSEIPSQVYNPSVIVVGSQPVNAQYPNPVYTQGTTIQPQHPQQNVYVQGTYVDQMNQGGQYPVQANQTLGPPVGRWRDGICDCFNNLWPSCGCVFIWNGVWLVGQIAQKTNFATFKSIVIPILIINILFFILSFILPGWFYFIPGTIILIFSLFLRFHIAKMYNIPDGVCLECLAGFFCCPCSIAQMARHVFGYRKVFDGDSDPEVQDYYGPRAV